MSVPTHKTAPQNHPISWSFFLSNSNGKEKDYESGFHYYGARYYWSELLTGWLSVDPLADKYPSISPYNYCMWNPIKLVDPNGMDTLFSIATNLPDNNQNKENSIILSWMREEGDIPGMVSICMHGDPQKVRMSNTDGNFESPLSAKGLATLFELGGFPDYEKNVQANKTTIFLLYCCNTGQGDNSFGKQFSLEMQGIVIAPEGRVCVPNDSHNLYNWTNKNTPINQPWNVYYRGRLVTSFTGILPREWINNQGGIESATQKIIDTDRNAHPWGWHQWWK